MRRIWRRPSAGTVFGFAALVVAIGGVAFAAIPDSGGTIHGCYKRQDGDLRVVESASDCRRNERALDWSRGSSFPGATKMYVQRGSGPAGQFVTLYEIPGLLRARFMCEENPNDPPGDDLKTFTYEITNLQPDADLLVRQGLEYDGTVAPGGTVTNSVNANVRSATGEFGADFQAYGAGTKAAQGKGGGIITNSCAVQSFETQAISNVIA
jgi:hypothetical protein